MIENRGRHCEERKRRSNPFFVCRAVDCFAEPVIGRRFAPTRWLAMTVSVASLLAIVHAQDDAGSLGGTGNPLLPAVAPPSIGSVTPVIQRDSSLARNSTP